MKVTMISILIGTLVYIHQRMGTETGVLGNKRTSRDHSKHSNIEIIQNSKKSPEVTGCHSYSSEKPSANAGVKNF